MKKIELLSIFFLVLPFIFLQFRSEHLFVTHDGEYHIERTFNYVTAWKEGVLLPSWAQYYNDGFGSPIFVFLFPVAYWITSFINLLGISLVPTLKLSFIIFQFIAALSAYLWLRNGVRFSRLASYVGAMAFVYAPYSLVQVFARGTLREFAATALFPLILLLLNKLRDDTSIRYAGILGLFGGLFLLTDGITAVVFSFFIICYGFYLLFSRSNKLRFVTSTGLAGLVAILISGYIYLPFAFESSYLRESTAGLYKDHFVYFLQFFDPRWGFGFSMAGPSDSLSFQLGVVLCLSVFSVLMLHFKKKIALDWHSKTLLLLLGLYVFLTWHNPITIKLWEFLPFIQAIQLPWRFLAPISLLGAYFTAMVIQHLNLSGKRWFAIFYLLMLLFSFKYLRTNQILVFNESKLYTNTDDATAFHEFIPRWRVTTSEFSGFDRIEAVSTLVDISNVKWRSHNISFDTYADEPSIIRINTLYFPGWTATIDNQNAPIQITTQKKNEPRDITGLMSISVPEGSHHIEVFFSNTPPRSIGKYISFIGICTSFVLIFMKRKGNRING